MLLNSLLVKLGIVTALSVGIYGYGYYNGKEEFDKQHKAELDAKASQYMEEVLNEIERSEKLSKQFIKLKQSINTKKEERSQYILSFNDCSTISDDLVRLHDSAASNQTLLESPTGTSCKTSTITNTQFAQVLNNNYSNCNQYIQQLNSLIDFEEQRTKE